jgi:hypothetical protein
MLRHLYLRLAQDFLEMADAQLAPGKEIQDPQPCGVAEALIDLD